MKKVLSMLFVVVMLCLSLGCLIACQEELVPEDIAAQLQLEMNSTTAKQKVTVKTYVDGDTTHFNVPTSVVANGTLKARYLAVDTPESTNVIEDYGKKASKFTKEKLSTAKEIYIESNDDKWNADSTGSRYTVWVWYNTAENETFRCLNVELLQNGLAKPNNISATRYATICNRALEEAKRCKLYVWSEKEDPDLYRGPTVKVTLKDLRTNLEEYVGMRVAIEGVVTRTFGETAYVEAYDEETQMYYGMACYYGFTKIPAMVKVLSVGNKVYVAGNLEYYEAGGTYQLSNLQYSAYIEEGDIDSVRLLGTGYSASYTEVPGSLFADGTKEIVCKDGVKRTFGFAELTMNTTISMSNLTVTDIYTTNNGGDNDGAMTLTCTCDGKTIKVRTNVFRDADQNLITSEAYAGKTIDVKGLVEFFDGEYQIKVVTPADVTVHE